MSSIINFFANNGTGIAIMLSSIAGVVMLVQWLSWIFELGRYSHAKEDSATRQSLRFLVAEMLTKIINEFRHLFALIMVIIFAIALGYAMLKAGSDYEKLLDGIQVVVASLGGLIGSIIGYYFGESAAQRQNQNSMSIDSPPDEPEQNNVPPIEPAPLPPFFNGPDEQPGDSGSSGGGK